MPQEDASARSERRLPPRTRPLPADRGDEEVTVVCRCGVVMTLAWRTAETVRCFGCSRAFEPPPTATAKPLRWRPELAARPEHPLLPVARVLLIAGVLLALLGAALGLLFTR